LYEHNVFVQDDHDDADERTREREVKANER
jgi:hypothetical protein